MPEIDSIAAVSQICPECKGEDIECKMCLNFRNVIIIPVKWAPRSIVKLYPAGFMEIDDAEVPSS